MMKKLLPLLLLAVPLAYGQITITGLAVALDEAGNPDVGPNCIRVQYTVAGLTGSHTRTMSGGLTTGLGASLPTTTYTANQSYYDWMCHASSGETWYYEIDIDGTDTTCPVTCTDCTSSDHALFAADSNGINCTTGQPWRYTHPAYGTVTPTAPVHADTNAYDDCDSDLSPDTVASYAALNSTLSTLCGSAGTHKVVMAPGVYTTATQFTLPTSCAATHICVEPDWSSDPQLEPLETSQISYGQRDQMVVIQNTNVLRRVNYGTSSSSIIKAADNFTFRAFVFEDVQTPQTPIQRTVSSYASNVLTLSTSCPSEFQDSVIVMLNMPGLTAYPAVAEIASCSGTTLTLKNSPTLTGTLSGNGYVTLGALPVSTCAETSPITCDYSGVTNAIPTGNYTGYDRLYVEFVNGQTGANGRWPISAVDADTISLTGSTTVGAFVSSPYAYIKIDTGSATGSAMLAGSTTNFHCVQCIIHPMDTGAIGHDAVVSHSQSTGFIFNDGIIQTTSRNCPIGSDGASDCPVQGSRTGAYFRADGAQDSQYKNNLLIGSHGTAGLNVQNFYAPIRDMTFQGNHMLNTDRWVPDIGGTDFPGSYNMFTQMRHCIELKTGIYRGLIKENYFSKCAFDANNSQGVAIAINNTPGAVGASGVYRVQDLEVSWNYADGVGTFVAPGQQVATSNNNLSFVNRYYVHDNFIRGKGTRLQPDPGGSENTGNQLQNRGGAQYFVYENNTHIESEGNYGGGVFNYQSDKWPECSITGNVFTYHEDSANSGGVRFGPSLTDYDESSYLAEFNKVCPNARSNFANLLIKGVEDSQDVAATKSTPGDATNITDAEMSAAWATTGTFTGINLGPSTTTYPTYAERWAAAFAPDGRTLSPYTSFGVTNFDALLRGVFRRIIVSSTWNSSSSQLTFALTAPTTSACTARLTSDGWTTASSQSGAGGSYAQSIIFSGIGAGTYEAYIECPNAKPFYWSKTLP